jgi:hypothetical protein
VKLNNEMEQMLTRAGRASLDGELADIARSGFVERDGCVFLASLELPEACKPEEFPR